MKGIRCERVSASDIRNVAQAIIDHYSPSTIMLSRSHIRFHSYLLPEWINYLYDTHHLYLRHVELLYKKLLPKHRLVTLEAMCLIMLHEKMGWENMITVYKKRDMISGDSFSKQRIDYDRVLRKAVEVSRRRCV